MQQQDREIQLKPFSYYRVYNEIILWLLRSSEIDPAIAISNIGILYKRRNNVIVSVDKWLFK